MIDKKKILSKVNEMESAADHLKQKATELRELLGEVSTSPNPQPGLSEQERLRFTSKLRKQFY